MVEESEQNSFVGIAPARKRMKQRPPSNPIIGQKRADEWDLKIDRLLEENQNIQDRQDLLIISMRQLRTAIAFRDILVYLLCVAIIGMGILAFTNVEHWG